MASGVIAADQVPQPAVQAVAPQAAKQATAGMVSEAKRMVGSLDSVRLAISDQAKTFTAAYPKATQYLAEVDALEQALQEWIDSKPTHTPGAADTYAKLTRKVSDSTRRILLDNPLLRFEKLLVASGGIWLASNWDGACRMGTKLQVLSPVAPGGTLTTLYNGAISSYDLDWDAGRILFSDGRRIMEINADGTGLRVIKGPDKDGDASKRYNPCRLPNGDIMFVSTACEHAVPCTGGGGVGNMHVMDAEGNHERRVTYDQDHNWDPTLLNNGRVVYARWEYTDLPHYFSRLLMSMNPDGTDQKEYYGSSSYWPNAMYWTRPIPGHPTRIVTIVSGHHGVRRMGELHILDPALGRHEADGSVQQIPGRGKKVEPVIRDNLVGDSWPKFITPYPLGTSPQVDGAGTYFLATVKLTQNAPWRLCLVDSFDNITPILEGQYAMPVPLVARARPPVLPSRVDVTRQTGTATILDVYTGPGLRGFPKGSIKALRVGSYHYRYPGNGDTHATALEGGWDIRRILGTVPVYDDGSACFEVPANTPLFVQPLDADGQALQVMRSWFTCQPGENLSCIGCHENQNMAPPSKVSEALRQAPDSIAPWQGPARAFSFEREVQPVLDRKCVGCHDGSTELTTGGTRKAHPDFRAKRHHQGYQGRYSPAYMALQRYVRRAGVENDYHVPSPGEYQADTSHLMKLLKKGHPSSSESSNAASHVRLTREEWDRLYTWIDFNIPYPGRWAESHRHPNPVSVSKREKALKLYSRLSDSTETTSRPLPGIAPYEAPPQEMRVGADLEVDGWPLEPGVRDQGAGGKGQGRLDLGDGIKMALVGIPAGRFVMGDANGFADERPQMAEIREPFLMGATEVSLQQYRQFDPTHENKFVSTRWKDRTRRGEFCMDRPELPVVRVSQEQAMAFCEWLSRKTGRTVTLPSETQWEWACRAGSDQRFSFGKLKNNRINIADKHIAKWNYGRSEKGYVDQSRYTKAVGAVMPPNAWGLYDMHGNVAEWTTSDYVPLKDVGGAPTSAEIPYKVVRGGSWNDTARFATSASRWRYPRYQPVYDVGFRVIVKDAGATLAATRNTTDVVSQ